MLQRQSVDTFQSSYFAKCLKNCEMAELQNRSDGGVTIVILSALLLSGEGYFGPSDFDED